MEAAEYERMDRLEGAFWWYRALHRRVLDAARRCLSATPGPRILDAGCGTGGMAAQLAGLGSVTALDVSALAVRRARRRVPAGSHHLGQASVERLPLRDDSFDLVVSLDVLCNGAVGEEAAALREMARVTRPGGHLLLNLPAFPTLLSEHDRQVRNVRRYTRPHVRRLLEAAGLAPVRLTYWNSFLFLPAAAVRLARRGASGGRSELEMPPEWLNSLLGGVVAAEHRIGRLVSLPFGLSLFAVAQRPAAGGR